MANAGDDIKQLIKAAEARYPATEKHKRQVTRLFSKILNVKYVPATTQDRRLEALASTLMYFASSPSRQREIKVFLNKLISTGSHYEKILACALTKKIKHVKRAREDISLDNSVLNNPMPIGVMGAQYARTGVEINKFKNIIDIEAHFPWSLTDKEIRQDIDDNKELLSVLNVLSGFGVADTSVGVYVGLAKAFYDVKKGGSGFWGGVIVCIGMILTYAHYQLSLAQSGVKREADHRDLWAKQEND